MPQLQPSSFDITLIYKCPKCQSSHWFTSQEAKSGMPLNCCDEVFFIQPIKNIKINCQYDGRIPQRALKVLKEYGYNEEEIKSAGIFANTDQHFIQKFLASRLDTNELTTNQIE